MCMKLDFKFKRHGGGFMLPVSVTHCHRLERGQEAI